jgi:hypothetical protein
MEVHKPKFVKGLIAEIFVIVIGISLAVLAERMVEHFQHRKEARGVASRMVAELRRDSADLHFNMIHHQLGYAADSLLTDWSRGLIELEDDSLKLYAGRSLNFTFFASNTAEIEALKGSGKLYLIEDEELLSTILKHYDRYADFDLFTSLGQKLSQRISDLYKEHASLKTNMNFTADALVYEFNAEDLRKNLRGNRMLENLLQEKRVMDAFVIQRSRTALKRTEKIIAQLQGKH